MTVTAVQYHHIKDKIKYYRNALQFEISDSMRIIMNERV